MKYGWIIVGGAIYSLLIASLVSTKAWSGAAFLFCYGITLLGARIAELIERASKQ